MAYQTGTAAGTTDLLDKLNVFAAANGWTVDRRDASSISLHKSSVYISLWEDGSEIQHRLATGFDNGLAWNAQPGGNTRTQRSLNMIDSFTRYHFFASSNYLYIVVEVDPGLYKHIAFGLLAKSSNYDGGEFSCSIRLINDLQPKHGLFGGFDSNFGAYYNNMNNIRINQAGVETIWRMINARTEEGYVVVSSESWYQQNRFDMYLDWFTSSPNTATQQTILVPIHLYAMGDAGNFHPLGYVEDLRLVNMTNIDPGETVTIGSDQWLIFPAWQKGVVPSYNNGYAYKIIS